MKLRPGQRVLRVNEEGLRGVCGLSILRAVQFGWLGLKPMKFRFPRALIAVLIATVLLAPFFGIVGIAVPVRAESAGSERSRPAMTLTITPDQRVLLDGRAMPLRHLEEALWAAGFPARTLIMRADRKTPHSFVSRVLEVIRPCTHANLLVWETTGLQ